MTMTIDYTRSTISDKIITLVILYAIRE